MSRVRRVGEARAGREELAARWLTLMALALLVLSGAVLALEARAYGWSAALFAATAVVACTTGALGWAPGSVTAPARTAISRRRTLFRTGTRRRPAGALR